MFLSKQVTIAIANPNFSFSSENSAVVAYLKGVGNTFEKNGFNVTYLPTVESGLSTKIASNKFRKFIISTFKFLAPGLLFNKKFSSYFNQVDLLNEEFSAQLKSSDYLIEFSSFGGEIGVLHKRKNKGKYILIFDAPLIVQFEEMYLKSGKFAKRIEQSERESVIKANQIICYSNAVKSYLTSTYSDQLNISVLPCINWKNAVIKNLDNTRVNFGFIGSFLVWHKVEILVKAFESLAKKYDQIHLTLIGFGEEWNRINNLVLQSLVSNRITITGFVSDDELEQLKSKMDIGIMPGSNWYGSPLKLYEYAESGIPIIAPETPTVTEYFIHNKNALIIDAKNELDSLIQHMESFILDTELRQRIGSEGFKMMQNDFAKEKVLSKFVELIKENE